MRCYLFLILIVVGTLTVSAKKKSSKDSKSSEDQSKCNLNCSEVACNILDEPEKDLVCGEGIFSNVKHVVRAKVLEETSSNDKRKTYNIELKQVYRSNTTVVLNSSCSGIKGRLVVPSCITPSSCFVVENTEYIFFMEKFKIIQSADGEGQEVVLKYKDRSSCFVWFKRAFGIIPTKTEELAAGCDLITLQCAASA